MKLVVFYFTLSLLGWTSAFTLSGPCPTIFPIWDLIRDETHYRVIGKVNFDTPSAKTFLFGGVLEESCDVNLSETTIILEEHSETRSVHGNITKLYGITYTAEMRVAVSKNKEIPQRFNESFRIWIIKYGVFLWSCLNGPDNNTHDEGMMVLMDTNLYTESWFTSNLEEILSDTKSIIRNYFSEALIDVIKWEDGGEHEFCKLKTLPHNMPMYQKSIILVIVLVIASCIVRYYLSKRNSGDQVVPVE